MHPPPPDNHRRRGVVQLGLAVLAISTAAPFVRAAQPAPAVSVAALRLLFAAIVLTVLAGPSLVRHLRAMSTRERGLLVLAGVLLGTHLAVWIASLYFTSTAASVALVATNPMFAAMLGFWLGDRVQPREWAGIGVAALGCAVLAGGDWQAGGDALIGDCLALMGAALAAGSLVIGRRLRSALPLLPYLAGLNIVAATTLLVLALAMGSPLLGLSTTSYAAIAGATLIASLGGHTLLNAAVRHTPTHLVSLAILGEPIGASLLTWAFFSEQPPAAAVLGGAIVLVGIGVGFTGRRAPRSTPASTTNQPETNHD